MQTTNLRKTKIEEREFISTLTDIANVAQKFVRLSKLHIPIWICYFSF